MPSVEGPGLSTSGGKAGVGLAADRGKPLTEVDATRISAIVEEAMEKLSFLASITPDVLAHRDELSQIVGDEITRIIQEQRTLEGRYDALLSQRYSMKARANKAKFAENQEAIKEVARLLRESTRELCKNLKGNPNIAENLGKIQSERSILQTLLSKTLRELRESSFTTLTTTVEEEKMRTEMLLEVTANEKRVSDSVKSLQEQLTTERQQHETDVQERYSRAPGPGRSCERCHPHPICTHNPRRTEIIGKLKEEFQDLRTRTSIETQFLHKESRGRNESKNRVYAAKKAALVKEIDRVQKQLDIERKVNGETETFLRNKWQSLQVDIERWSQRYETELEEKEKELDTLNTYRAEDLVRLNNLKERYDSEMEEKKRRDEESRLQVRATHLEQRSASCPEASPTPPHHPMRRLRRNPRGQRPKLKTTARQLTSKRCGVGTT